MENIVRDEAAQDGVEWVLTNGMLADVPIGRLSCAFQWYAVSACNYAQLVGWLATQNPVSATDYVARNLPRLLQYRSKVAAHFALASPRGDNEADLAGSVMTHIIYIGGRLSAAAMTPVLHVGDEEISVSNDFSRSLTQAHESLTRRYWPDGPQQAFESLPIGAGETITLNVQLPHPDHDVT